MKGLASENELDNSKYELDTAQKKLSTLKSQLDNSEQQLTLLQKGSTYGGSEYCSCKL